MAGDSGKVAPARRHHADVYEDVRALVNLVRQKGRLGLIHTASKAMGAALNGLDSNATVVNDAAAKAIKTILTTVRTSRVVTRVHDELSKLGRDGCIEITLSMLSETQSTLLFTLNRPGDSVESPVVRVHADASKVTINVHVDVIVDLLKKLQDDNLQLGEFFHGWTVRLKVADVDTSVQVGDIVALCADVVNQQTGGVGVLMPPAGELVEDLHAKIRMCMWFPIIHHVNIHLAVNICILALQ